MSDSAEKVSDILGFLIALVLGVVIGFVAGDMAGYSSGMERTKNEAVFYGHARWVQENRLSAPRFHWNNEPADQE